MRSIHFLSSVDLNKGGVSSAVLNSCQHLQQAGTETCLFTRARMEHVSDWTPENKAEPTLIELPDKQSRSSLLSRGDLQFFANRLQPGDVVHLHGMWELVNHQIARVCRQAGVPYCVSTHGMLDEWSMSQRWLKKRIFWHLMGKKYLSGAFAIHTTATEEKRQVEPWVQGTPVHVVPCLFELEAYEQLPGPQLAVEAFGLREDEKVILFLSRIHLKKGVELLIDAMQQVRKEQPTAIALLAGPGDADYIAKIQSKIESQGLDDCIKLLGPVHGDTKLSLYQRADIFALPTFQENFGFVLPEAMACGTPVITTQGVDIWRELASGGVQVVGRTADDFAQKILELLLDDGKRASLGKQGRTWVFDALEPSKITAQYVKMYETCNQVQKK